MSEHRTFKYFKEETLEAAAAKYGWTLIDDSNRKDMFMDMVRRMDMSYSYKPVLMLAVLACADGKGRMKLSDLVQFFRNYYADRRSRSLIVEKPNSLYCREDVTDKEIERNILANPFKRFEDMQMMRHTRTLGIVEVDNSVWMRLTEEGKAEIRGDLRGEAGGVLQKAGWPEVNKTTITLIAEAADEGYSLEEGL